MHMTATCYFTIICVRTTQCKVIEVENNLGHKFPAYLMRHYSKSIIVSENFLVDIVALQYDTPPHKYELCSWRQK